MESVLTVISYGSGEVLKNIFEASAMLLNSNSDSYMRPIMSLSGAIGAFWATSKLLFDNNIKGFLTQYFLPVLVTVGVLLVPTTSVHVEDVLKNRSYKVDHVPLLLGKFSELVSSIGYNLTKGVETIMHIPGDTSYNSTGMIFGAQSSLDMDRYVITDGNLSRNLSSFCKQCVLYDISLGKYKIEDLKKSTDLLTFFEEKTSKVRMIRYIDEDIEGNIQDKASYVNCKDAISKMKVAFDKERNFYLGIPKGKELDAKTTVINSLPTTFQALTGLQKSADEIINQQLMTSFIRSEFTPEKFAIERAHLQQKSTYQVMGGLAATSLVTMRSVFEALIIASFIFIVPLSLFPGGVKFFSTWVQLLLWVQMWPPFYAILNYIMQSIAQEQAGGIFYGLSEMHQGLSLFTSVGLKNLYEDMFALAGYLSASIPFISWSILKGGVGSFVHLAGAMMTPAHQAAGSAAGEMASGNYSLANVNYGGMQYGNSSMLQRNMAPSLSAGFSQTNDGNWSTTTTNDGNVLMNENSSHLRNGLHMRESFIKGQEKNYTEASSRLETAETSLNESTQAHSSNTNSFMETVSKNESFSKALDDSVGFNVSESYSDTIQDINTWAKKYGISEGTNNSFASNVIAKASVGTPLSAFIGTSVSASTDLTSSLTKNYGSSESQEELQSIVGNSQFIKNSSDVESYSRKLASSEQFSDVRQSTDGYSNSLSNSKTASENHREALTNSKTASESLKVANSLSLDTNKDHTSEFVSYAVDKLGSSYNFKELSSEGRDGLVSEYVNNRILNSPKFTHTPDDKFSVGENTNSHQDNAKKVESFHSQEKSKLTSMDETKTIIHENSDKMKNKFNDQSLEITSEIEAEQNLLKVSKDKVKLEN
jgi:conjugal transfer mating pair stabilization protein TraG